MIYNYEKISETQYKLTNQIILNNNLQLSDLGEQLKQNLIEIATIPAPNPTTGQQVGNIYYNPITKEVTYGYIDIEPTLNQKVTNLQNGLIQTQNALNSLLGV
ncbi:hypothetical protein [Clostridium tyrobutyricum]|uniref:hypothetical protein n=1 Tax=Clostridium tyrobutyricum TaxID=1519 RepID=UPI001C386E81|nr:hypothetical protein [Clostridium tyrobutyricum]MBV4423666.1 hypothetical protein [Clostridium tyrobutyricum]